LLSVLQSLCGANLIEVIGGSVAGLSAALELKKRIHDDVVVYEEHPDFGKPLKCAECWVDHYGVGTPPEQFIKYSITHLVLKLGNRQMAIKTTGSYGMWMIDRPAYEKWLAERCEEEGVLLESGRRVKISELEGDLIVDASGCPSEYSREFDVPVRASRAVQCRAEGDFSQLAGKILAEPSFDFIGYYWIFPISNDEANVGIGELDGNRLNLPKKRLEQYVDGLNAKPTSWTAGWVGTVQHHPLYIEKHRIALIGDAAGLANPTNGEGIAEAIISAKVLAECAARGDMRSYEPLLLQILRKERRFWKSVLCLWKALASVRGLCEKII
jgi:digeranylgeranylglycerophospholipid reductase